MAKFGGCCDDLNEAMNAPPDSLLRVEDNGVLYLAVGFVNTPEGIGWFDQAVIFCPFCGSRLQTREEVQSHAGD